MQAININGVELELDLLDADVVEKYEYLMQDIRQKINDPSQYEGLENADQMRKQCLVIDGFFNELFGEDTSGKIFPKSGHLGMRMEAFAQVAAAGKMAGSEMHAIAQKYDLERIQNREQRRQQMKKKKGKYQW